MSLTTRRNSTLAMRKGDRVFLLAAGLCLLALAARVGIGTADVTGLTSASLLAGYSAAVTGCMAIFAATLGLQGVPPALRYGGRISYGLYVFHSGTLQLSTWLVEPLHLTHLTARYAIAVDTVALVFAMGIAIPFLPILRKAVPAAQGAVRNRQISPRIGKEIFFRFLLAPRRNTV